MAYAVRGVDILTFGELNALVRDMPPDGRGSGALAAWQAGEALSPDGLHAALDVEARLAVRTAVGEQIIDYALAKLRAAFPTEVPG